MSEIIANPHRGRGLPALEPLPCADASGVAGLLAHCPAHAPTPLRDMPALPSRLGVARVHVKDERDRMGLGSFKALGAAHAIAREAAQCRERAGWERALRDRVFVTASAGNHGLSVAAGARLFGAKAVVYLAETVPEAFATRLREKGAEVVRAGAHYEASMEAAERAAQERGWTLLSDSSWPGYTALPAFVMEGYLQLAAETVETIDTPPTHILLQAGVGGLAAAAAAYFRAAWGDQPVIIVVEPEVAPALLRSVSAGRVVTTEGPVSTMGRLDCKTPSLIALAGLSRDADLFVTISDNEAHDAVAWLEAEGLATTASGAAGLAAVLARRPGLSADARILAILSEGPERG
jgi:diaminopropionate ammonia-lyase